jgi:hypothetical protein
LDDGYLAMGSDKRRGGESQDKDLGEHDGWYLES